MRQLGGELQVQLISRLGTSETERGGQEPEQTGSCDYIQ